MDNVNAQITDVWTINPHLNNEARMGFTWQGNWWVIWLSVMIMQPSWVGNLQKLTTSPASACLTFQAWDRIQCHWRRERL